MRLVRYGAAMGLWIAEGLYLFLVCAPFGFLTGFWPPYRPGWSRLVWPPR